MKRKISFSFLTCFFLAFALTLATSCSLQYHWNISYNTAILKNVSTYNETTQSYNNTISINVQYYVNFDQSHIIDYTYDATAKNLITDQAISLYVEKNNNSSLIALQIVYHLESYNKYSGFVLKFNELDGKKNIVANYNLQIKIVNPNVNRLGALEYLSQITYSIFYSLADVGDSAHGCIGTAWLLSRLQNTTYTYYLATNMHVIQYAPLNKINKGYINADPQAWSWSSPYSSNYQAIDFLVVDPDNFFPEKNKGIDFGIIKINFATICSKSSFYRDRLDRYNNANYSSISKNINNKKLKKNVTNISTRLYDTGSTNWYIGGYPVISGYTTWEEHEIEYMEMIDSIAVSANHKILDPVMSYDPVTKKPINFPTLIYPDTEANNTKFSDYSYLYVLNEKTADTWMVGGASGSAVINDDYQVVGIYWGGYEYAYDLENEIYFFLPCIDAFNAVFSWNTNSKFLTGQL